MENKKLSLEGLKILDFGWVAAVPITTKYLADHGAQVVKVESHTIPDPSRMVSPFKGKATVDTSGFFAHHNSSKFGITLNLTEPKGKEIQQKLIMWADVLVENMTPGAMKRLGLDYESVRKIKPDIIYYSTCIHGQYGPLSLAPGFGQLASSLGGIYGLSGWPDGEPLPPHGAYTDYSTSPLGTLSILAALEYRRRTGKGQYIDLSQVEAGIHLIAPVFMNYMVNGHIAKPTGNRISDAVPHGAFQCKGDDRWIAIGVRTDEQWQALVKVMGEPEWTKENRFTTFSDRKENEDELERLLDEWTKNYTAEELEDMLQNAGVPAAVAESTKDLFDDPQLQHRKHYNWLDHAALGRIAHDSPAFRLSKTPYRQTAAPIMGQHNHYVYIELLGLSEDDFYQLIVDKVITTDADLPTHW